MTYKNLDKAFLFQIIVAVISIFFVSLFGVKGVAICALIALKPVIFERVKIKSEKAYLQMSINIARTTAILMIATILVLNILSFDFLFSINLDKRIWVDMVIPYLLFTLGIVGWFYASSSRFSEKIK